MENEINKREKVGSVAIQQALRFYYGFTYRQVAALCKVHSYTVWKNCNGKYGVLAWHERTRKNEAIEAGERLIWDTPFEYLKKLEK